MEIFFKEEVFLKDHLADLVIESLNGCDVAAYNAPLTTAHRPNLENKLVH